jgi:polyhydroxybutyrate depolymerase
VSARRCAVLLLVVVASGCGGGGGDGGGADARARSGGAATPSSCAERLPLDTLLDVPGGPRGPRPLILALHGARRGGYGMQYTGLSDDARDFFVAYPNTPHDNGFWRVEDVPRLLALVDVIGRCVPVTGVTAVGFSNGGLMANALACRAAERVRALVLVASGYEGLGRCAPSRPVSVLSIHGSADQVVPYPGMRAFVASWARRDGCAAVPSACREDGGVTHLRWRDCDDGTRVEHLRVAGDTRGWPALLDANERMVRLLRAAG